MAGLPHHRLAAETGDLVEQDLTRLDVGNDRCAGPLGQHLTGINHHQLIGVQHAPLLVDDADAIAVAIEGDAQRAVSFGH